MPVDFARLISAPAMAIFGRAVMYLPPGGAGVERSGIFDSAHEIIRHNEDEGADFSSINPTLSIREADWPDLDREGMIEFDGRTFWIFDIEPDGQGSAVIVLKERV